MMFKHKPGTISKVKRKPYQDKYEIVLNNLLNKGLINQDHYKQLLVPLKKPMTQELLVEKLVQLGVINPREPLDQSFKDFKDDLGSLNAGGLVLLVNALRTDKKGLKEMTPIPAKAFPIPAQHLFLIILAFALGAVIVLPSLPQIEHGLGMGTAGAGGNPLSGLTGIFSGLGGKH